MIRINKDLHINPAFVASLEWDRSNYAFGPSDSVLVITMHDGKEHLVRHQPWYLDGTDAYAVERQILASIEEGDAR
ncbi:hypothetical protein CKO11_06910 [Rhodobacter sp. TJ_12]|uniref:hypothetical protein n=1 Tax=Rhodobacter sp. TJ_12 TaxID=2029399 RepID=UPI001CBE649B|nr:hypothetical protein [Rhodobacter sp. TJ_12]MBZ4022185.1 hypothetical protein [Rhodobacter sp. TJ_12]